MHIVSYSGSPRCALRYVAFAVGWIAALGGASAAGAAEAGASASGVHLDTRSFILTRASSAHSAALYGAVSLGAAGALFAVVENPRTGYNEAIGGVVAQLERGGHSLGLALAFSHASDGEYVQLYVAPSLELGRWSLAGTVELYEPWQGSGTRQLYLDPLTLLRRLGSRWELGAAYALGVAAGDAPQHRGGPAAQFSWAGGSMRAELLRDFRNGSTDGRLVYQRSF